MVIKKILRGDKYVYMTLQEMLDYYNIEAPQGWFLFIQNRIDEALYAESLEDQEKYLKNNELISLRKKRFDFEELRRFYNVLKKTKYNSMFDDDILKYISFIKVLGFFEKIGYKLDDNNPCLDDWFSSVNPFRFGYSEELLKEAYSMMDLLPLRHGMNAIRSRLIQAQKKLW